MKRRARFVYKEPTQRDRGRRLRIYQFDQDIVRAHRGDTKGLRHYLETPDLPLSRISASRLPTLSTGKLSESGAVAPVALLPVLNPAREAENLVAYLVRKKALSLYGDKPVPRGKLNQLSKRYSKRTPSVSMGMAPLA